MQVCRKAEKHIYLKMDVLLYFSVLILSMAVGFGLTGMSPVKELYLDSYHLCNRTETKNVIKFVSYQKTSETRALCGWIPFRWCTKTHYQTDYRSIEVPETMQVTDCCEDYEQLGQYCALSLNRSNEFTSRPGVCPADDMMRSNISCTIDLDCPGLQKCCRHANRSTCSTPIPEAPVNNWTKYWYNATVDVKMEFVELRRLDPQFMNHTRLLHSMITGALWPFNVSVHPITTVQAETFTVESQLLIGFQEPAILNEVSEKLQEIVRRIPEVININVKDVNECTYPELNLCSKEEVCRNLEGFYNCYGHHEPPGMNSSRPDDRFPDTMNSTPHSALSPFTTNNRSVHEGITTPILPSSLTDPWCYCSRLTDLSIFNVAADRFQMSWSMNSSLNHTFQVELRSMSGTPVTVSTNAMHMVVSGLEAGTLYNVSITYQDCAGHGHTLTEKVKTDAEIVTGSLRITNYIFTEKFNDTSSLEYQNFTSMLEKELLDALSHTVPKEKLRVKIISLRAGSIIAEFKVIIMDTDIAVNISRMSDSLSYLNQSKTLVIDPSSSSLRDLDECASPLENDCSPDALCINTEGSYTCECKAGFIDLEVTSPGRNCRVSAMPIPTSRPTTTGSSEVTSASKSATDPFGPPTSDTTNKRTQITTQSNTTQASSSVPQTWVAATHQPSTTDVQTESNISLINSTMHALLGASNHTSGGTSVGHSLITTPNSSNSSLTVTEDKTVNTWTLKVEQNNTIHFTTKSKNRFDVNLPEPNGSPDNLTARNTSSTTTENYTNNSSLASTSSSTLVPSIAGPTSSNDTLHTTVSTLAASIPQHSATTLLVPSNATSGRNATITSKSESDSGSHTNNSSLPVVQSPKTVSFTPAASSSSAAMHSSINTLIPAVPQPSPTPLPLSTTHSSKATTTTTTTTTIASRVGHVSLKGNAEVECFSASIVVKIDKAFLSNVHISASSLTFGEASCNMSTTVEDLHVKVTVAWPSECVYINTNTTHISVSGLLFNTIKTNIAGQFKVNSNVTCTYKKDINLSSGDGVVNEGELSYDSIEAVGSLQPEFLLFSESGEVGKNGTLRTDETARIEIGINTLEATFKMVLNDCWASNSSDSSYPAPHFLIKDRCAVAGTSTYVEKNGADKKAVFATKIFANIDAPVVYLHCKLHICKEVYNGSCIPDCTVARSAKNSEPYQPKYARIGPFRRAPGSPPQSPAQDSRLAPGYVVLIFLAVVSVIGAVSSVLIYRYYRRTGRYDFKPKCDTRGYLVFSN
ncbi:uromodulin-like 1 [Lissotriton helveticus]